MQTFIFMIHLIRKLNTRATESPVALTLKKLHSKKIKDALKGLPLLKLPSLVVFLVPAVVFAGAGILATWYDRVISTPPESGLDKFVGNFENDWSLLGVSQASVSGSQNLLNQWASANQWKDGSPQFFKIVSMGHDVGFSFFSEDENHEKQDLGIYIASRTGSSVSLHEIIFSLAQPSPLHENSIIQAKYIQYFQGKAISEHHFDWGFTGDQEESQFNLVTGNAIGFLPFADLSQADFKLTARSKPKLSFPFSESLNHKRNKNEGQKSAPLNSFIFDPLQGDLNSLSQFLAEQETAKTSSQINALHSENSIFLHLNGSLPLQFISTNQKDLASFAANLESRATTLDLVSSHKSANHDLSKLEKEAQKCLNTQAEIQESVVKSLANIPYLLHRKASVLKGVCQGALEIVNVFRSTQDAAARQKAFTTQVRATLRGHSLEIPRSMLSSPHWSLLFDNSKQALWVNALNSVIVEAQSELNDTLAFEENRKVPIKMQVILQGRKLGTVVKGLIKDKRLSLGIKVISDPEGAILEESWLDIPEFSNPQNAFQLVNGRSVDERVLGKLQTVCQNFDGKVGIDLGDAPRTLSSRAPVSAPRESNIRDSTIRDSTIRDSTIRDSTIRDSTIWDSNARIRLLDIFLRRSLANKECKEVIVRVSPDLKIVAEELVHNFESQIIQSKQEIQLTNSRFRYLTLAPGVYDLYVNSLVKGEFIEKYEFTVDEEPETGKKKGKGNSKTQNITLSVEPPSSSQQE